MAKSGKRNLKATLVSQQARLKKNEQAKSAAQVRDLKKGSKGPGTAKALDKGKGKEKGGRVEVPKRAVIPFDSTHKILLLGEGNFSFALALLKLDPPHYSVPWTHIPAYNVTATAYDTEEECYGKYPEAPKIVDELKTRGVRVLFGVDAGNLEKCKALRGQTWDRVVWNFPHAGKGIADQDRNILANQKLLLAFLRSVAPFLAQGSTPDFNKGKKKKTSAEDDEEDEDPGEENGVDKDDEERDLSALQNQKSPSRGTILVTLRNVSPYTEWNLPQLAKHPPAPPNDYTSPNPQYLQLRSFAFYRTMWEGYEHRMTKGERMGGLGTTGVGGEDRMWEFYLKD